jgi:hypothetical protein
MKNEHKKSVLASVGFVLVLCWGIWFIFSGERTSSQPTLTSVAMIEATATSVAANPTLTEALLSTGETVTVQTTVPAGTQVPTTTSPPMPTATSEPQVRVVPNAINVRAGPGTGFEILAHLYKDDTVRVLGRSDDGSWYLIAFSDGREGWVGASVVELITEGTDELRLGTSDTNEQGAGTFSELAITEVSYDGTNVVISGVTDLPDGAVLTVIFNVTHTAPEDSYVGISTNVSITAGQFTASMKPPDLEEYKRGPYEITIWFTPMTVLGTNQPASVLSIVGEAGENLVGEKIKVLLTGVRTFEEYKVVNLSLNIEVPTYPQVDVTTYPPNTRERALAEFLVAWQNQDWERMALFTQERWLSPEQSLAEELMYWYDYMGLLGAEIGPYIGGSQFEVIIYYRLNPTDVRKRLIRPTIVGESSPSGGWGVNPTSTLRHDTVPH